MLLSLHIFLCDCSFLFTGIKGDVLRREFILIGVSAIVTILVVSSAVTVFYDYGGLAGLGSTSTVRSYNLTSVTDGQAAGIWKVSSWDPSRDAPIYMPSPLNSEAVFNDSGGNTSVLYLNSSVEEYAMSNGQPQNPIFRFQITVSGEMAYGISPTGLRMFTNYSASNTTINSESGTYTIFHGGKNIVNLPGGPQQGTQHEVNVTRSNGSFQSVLDFGYNCTEFVRWLNSTSSTNYTFSITVNLEGLSSPVRCTLAFHVFMSPVNSAPGAS